ncbi:MAG: hypothetical protein ACM34I_05795, partial [bacterium]
MHKEKNILILIMYCIIFLLSLMLSGCGDSSSDSLPSVPSGTPVTPGPGGSVTVILLASDTSLVTGGSSDLTAIVLDAAGDPVPDGTAVNFSLSSGGALGTLSSATATTTGGIATVTYTAGTSTGTETITATEPGSGSSDSVIIHIGGVTVTANPASISTGGTSTITATVIDPATGSPVADGATVSFSGETLGTLSSPTA